MIRKYSLQMLQTSYNACWKHGTQQMLERPLFGKKFSTAAPSVADQMIDYAVKQCKGKHEQAVDVLRSGLSMHPDGKGLDAAKLLVALAGIESDRSNWTAALDAAGKANAALAGAGQLQGAAASARLHAGATSTQALLVTGQDSEARAAAAATVTALAPASDVSPLAARALGLALTTSHATADWPAAGQAAERLAGMAGTDSNAPADALLALAHWQVHQGVHAAAASTYKAAAEKAAAARAAASAQTGALDSEALYHELEAGALAGSGQLAIAAKDWSQAEEVLGKALSAAEKVSADNHPRVVPVLALLSYVYCRSARHTYGEGLLRECGKILKLDPGRYVPAGSATAAPTHSPLHPSLVALAAWRHSQLLHVMPNRGSEASAWEKAAREAWSHAGPVAQPSNSGTSSAAAPDQGAADGSIESVLGGPEHLKGQGAVGKGMIVDILMRRALPM
mmetsp:Transcript_7366/g.18280  ORF Transcript_7366/g.18280 Transcript_7366/m.18280 type:complete len:453 (-) Transcript_7366:132-1490(-)|eukprot:CAMPEP_0202860716 /NCGR_PEP_ID=MMETSP1391-20130828/2339_1 /ASSEMBLY_ACC=CAM_ASM_000867 /TAXON_ID=1034604 /ORGANISM="Chlamydomonas leiostraca, Strain SAG 11-49" /LENGTH=452 /DNA_ID=CAMNT_0049539949 /DNA_START=28 /DNA_END=1386 /DNA_ORIENTATION=-